ncbi:MAG: PLDc N-terminal domain-containing protein [Desulfobacteraceae bacterium]|nr:PLDc N-terminal domain-containing protein [Desulfobacteraceae bacterium]
MSTAQLIVLGGVLFYLLTCWAIFDIARRDFGGIEKKAIWAIVALIPFIGPIIYIAAGLRRGCRKRAGGV